MSCLTRILTSLILIPSIFAAPVSWNWKLPYSGHTLNTTIPICEDIPLNRVSNGELCLEPIFNQSLQSASVAASNVTNIGRRIEPSRSDMHIDPLDLSKTRCAKPSRAAPHPRKSDANALCNGLPSVITIAANPRLNSTYGDLALCQIFDSGTARYRVCNLDTCQTQVFVDNVKSCLELYERCPGQGATSGYRVGVNQRGMGFAMAITGTRIMGDYPFELNDDAFLIKQFQSTCSL